jgi:carbonic anhydrase
VKRAKRLTTRISSVHGSKDRDSVVQARRRRPAQFATGGIADRHSDGTLEESAMKSTPAMSTLLGDFSAGLVVFLVALPLCLGVALASNAPLFAGLVAGIIGGILVGLLSGSQTSVSGPAAGLTAIVAAQIAALGSFQALQLALVIAAVMQLGMGFARVGFLAVFFPSSVIKGLLAAIGVILILKQIPHVVGHHAVAVSDLAFQQADSENTFSELIQVFDDLHAGAALIGLLSIAVLVVCERWKPLKAMGFPVPLIVVLLGVGIAQLFQSFGEPWLIGSTHLVRVPVAESLSGFIGFFQWPDFTQWLNSEVYIAAATIAVVASLETLLNLEAVDKLDPRQRTSPSNRELLAQGAGNLVSGLLGGLPITAVVIRGSVNINAGAQTKLAAIVHGVLLLFCVAFLPRWLNTIPLSCLAAILLVTGYKLISPALMRRMWLEGWPQFIPFAVTVVAIVFSDLLTGVLIGLAVALGFILMSSVRRPLRWIMEKHLRGDVLHIELADQVSFLNRGALVHALQAVPRGGQVLLDARRTDYIDPDLLSVIRDFKDQTAPARGVELSLLGFRDKYNLGDRTRYVVHSTRELQEKLSPEQVLQVLKDGHARFRAGRRLTRDSGRQVADTSKGQHPLAVVVSCIDSRTPAELIFDLGVGDIFSVRIAGNVTSRKVLGSIEYGCVVAGAKLVLVMGHTRCGAVTAAIDLIGSGETANLATGCQHLGYIVEEIQQSIDRDSSERIRRMTSVEKELFADTVARLNVARSVRTMLQQSRTLSDLERDGQVVFVAAMYNIVSGDIQFLTEDGSNRSRCAEIGGHSNGTFWNSGAQAKERKTF